MLVLSDTIIERSSRPRNGGVLPAANAIGLAGALGFGAAVKLMLRIDEATELIEEARFQSYGCGIAIAASSAAAELVTRKTIDQAAAVTAADIAAFLGGLPTRKMYCAVMGYEAIQHAIRDYRKVENPPGDAVLLCKCHGVAEDMVARTVRLNRLTLPEEVTGYTRAAGRCTSCFRQVENLLQRVNAAMTEEGLIAKGTGYRIGSALPHVTETIPRGECSPHMLNPVAINAQLTRQTPRPRPPASLTPPSSRPVKRTGSEREALILGAIEDIRPHLQRDGGDCELVEVECNVVHVRLSGACVGCQMASVTLSGVQEKLAATLNQPLRVVPVQ